MENTISSGRLISICRRKVNLLESHLHDLAPNERNGVAKRKLRGLPDAWMKLRTRVWEIMGGWRVIILV
eukprot:scaffold978_cov230-Chaetoceros_neogracile.AAC.14